MTFNKSQGQTLDKALAPSFHFCFRSGPFKFTLAIYSGSFIFQHMEPRTFLLDAITPDTKNWTAKVSVLNKTEPRTSSQPTCIKFQKLLLADIKGNKVEGMLYRDDIELLRDSLRPHQTYLISNATVRPVKPGFENPLTNNRFQWILGARTAILATADSTVISSELAPTFIRCDQFRDFLRTKTLISTAAIVLEGRAPRSVTAKGKQHILHEYAAVDELLRPFIITFWNDAAPDNVYVLLDAPKEPHIIAALNFTVTDYHRYSIHKDTIAELQHQGNIFKQAQTPFGSDTEAITSVHTLLAIKEPDRCNLLAQGKLTRPNQQFIYPCCAKCHRLTSAEYNCLFDCRFCHEVRQAIPRFRFCLLIYDAFDEIEITVFGDEGEKIMQMSATDFLQKYGNGESLIIDSVNSNLRQLQLKMKIHSRVFNKQDGSTVLSHTMQALECQQLPSPILAPDETPTISPADARNVIEISAASKPTTHLLISPAKEHPRPDPQPSTSSRGRASKAKKVE
ncbi:hypothetical protein OROGR_022289 [Orobanche gracilis]